MRFIKINIIRTITIASLAVLNSELVLVSEVSASGASGAHPEISSLFYPSLNFVIYFFLMVFIYGKFAKPALISQRTDLESKVVKIQNEYETLNKEHEQLKDKLLNIEEEKSKVITELEIEARSLADLIISSANKKAERIKIDSVNRIQSERERLEEDLKGEMLSRVVTKVRTKLSGNFSEKEDSNFIKSFLSSAFK